MFNRKRGCSCWSGMTSTLTILAWAAGLGGCANEMVVAVQKSDVQKVESLLDAHPDMVFIRAKHAATPLHLAALSGNTDVAKLLLARRAPIEAGDASGWTPLHTAASTGRKEMVELLLSNHAQVNALDGHGKTPLHWAVQGNFQEVAKVLTDHGGR
jgi:ankyrin repeat protein